MNEQRCELISGPFAGRIMTTQPQVEVIEAPLATSNPLASINPLYPPIAGVWIAEYHRDHVDPDTGRWLFRWIRNRPVDRG